MWMDGWMDGWTGRGREMGWDSLALSRPPACLPACRLVSKGGEDAPSSKWVCGLLAMLLRVILRKPAPLGLTLSMVGLDVGSVYLDGPPFYSTKYPKNTASRRIWIDQPEPRPRRINSSPPPSASDRTRKTRIADGGVRGMLEAPAKNGVGGPNPNSA